MEAVYIFAGYTGVAVAGIITLKVFFAFWGVVDRKLNPGKIENAAEVCFKSLKNKKVTVTLENGTVLENHTYKKTLYFDTSDLEIYNPIYFELLDNQDKVTVIAARKIAMIQSE